MPDEILGYSLSPQQQRLWLLGASAGHDAFRARCALLVEGDAAWLDAALGRLTARHEILRTTYRRLAAVRLPLQVVCDAAPIAAREVAPPDVDPAGDPEALAAWIARTDAAPLDLEQGPPLRAFRASLSGPRTLVLLSLSTLCADRPTLEALAAELVEAPEDGPAQYADLAAWLEALRDKYASIAEGRVWQARERAGLASPRPCFAEAPGDAFQPGRMRVPLGPCWLEALQGCAAQAGVALPSLLLACWSVLLQRLSGGGAIAIGAPAGRRALAPIDHAMGLFTRDLPVIWDGARSDLSDLAAWLGAAEDLDERWASCVAAETSPAWLPYGFDFHDDGRSLAAAGRSARLLGAEARADRSILRASFRRIAKTGGYGLHAYLEYDPSAIHDRDAEEVARQLASILEDAPDRLHQPVARLGLRETPASAPRLATADDSLVHTLFERHAAASPDRIAVVTEEGALSYGELDLRASRLAGYLRALGITPDGPIAALLPRSLDAVVTLLAVMKVGGACAPLDPLAPPRRHETMLSRLAPPVIVTTSELAARLPSTPARVVLLDVEVDAIARALVGPSVVGPADRACYVLHTSGSTGEPKAVVVEHRSVVHYVRHLQSLLALPQGASFAVVSSLAADLGYTSLFGALCGGHTLHLISEWRALTPDALAEYFGRHSIDVLKIVPSHLKTLLSGAQPAGVLPRRWLVLGGDVCRWDIIERVRALAGGCAILGHYGPTETTIGVLAHVVEGPGRWGPPAVPLGVPIGDTTVHVLDPDLAPVSPWVDGEIFIGGPGVARGYLGHPDLTAERFVPSPFGPPGARLYRTGDRARRRRDGTLDFLGRADRQIKVRGVRVEIGEVEAALARHPAVGEAVVCPVPTTTGGDALVAYWVPADGAAATAIELRRHLGEHLPEPMVPQFFVELAVLPLTPNGKIDHAALPAPRPVVGGADAPRTDLEGRIAAIWRDILHIESVGLDDNFFDIGGHSLLMVEVHNRLHPLVPQPLSVIDLFRHPTVRALSAYLEGAAGPQLPPDVQARVQRQKESFARQRRHGRNR